MPPKQQTRRLPHESMSHAFLMRVLRVFSCFAVLSQRIQSRRAIGVISSHCALASGVASRALRRSAGILGWSHLAGMRDVDVALRGLVAFMGV